MNNDNPKLSLKTWTDSIFTRLVTSFVEESAIAFSMAKTEALKLTLASEEIFVYLCKTGQTKETLDIEAANGGYYVRMKFLFKARPFNPRAFNLTASIKLDDNAELEEMGLLIASRSVDRFTITEGPQQTLVLVIIKEKSYPELSDLKAIETKALKNFVIKSSDPDRLKFFVRLLLTNYPDHLYPAAFHFPGKLIDMITSNEYGAQIALDEQGRIGGGIIWRWIGSKTVESFGPYLFHQPPDSRMANDLINACLGQIAKTDAIGLISRYSTPEFPYRYFESLGSIDLFQMDGTMRRSTIYYRQLHEDPGCQVWAHSSLKEFLQAEYHRLFFGREILITRHEGEQRPLYSVFAPQFDRSHRQVTLRAIWDGADSAKNLAQHLHVLKAENIPNIFFEIDLAHAWQANLTETLLDNAFQPRLILPYGGEADIVLFQYQEGT
jgi:anti-sigma regulatory factor (Ser/Thr protein kinase)